jgi:uncharacterized protein YndB with AHSA1/START domain
MTTTTLAPVLRSISVTVEPTTAFRVFTEQIGAWWPIATHGMFGAECGCVGFEEGLLVERATDGRTATWGEVVDWRPPERLVFSWHPGREQDAASEVEVRFLADGSGTRVELEHRGWERFGEDAINRRRAYVGPGTWGAVLEHFADVAEPATDVPPMTELAEAYEAFFSEAEAGGHGPAPAEGEWDAARTVAHVTLNDAAMIAVTNAIIHERPAAFENVVCQDPAVLSAHVARFDGDLAAMVRHGREVAELARVAFLRLDANQRMTPVACRLLHDGEVVLDEPMPWDVVAREAQARRHLPAHTQQLRDLRAGTGSALSGQSRPSAGG